MIIASDGIWDALSSESAAKSCRGLPAELAARQVVKVVIIFHLSLVKCRKAEIIICKLDLIGCIRNYARMLVLFANMVLQKTELYSAQL